MRAKNTENTANETNALIKTPSEDAHRSSPRDIILHLNAAVLHFIYFLSQCK